MSENVSEEMSENVSDAQFVYHHQIVDLNPHNEVLS